MTDFKNKLDQQSKNLMGSFSSLVSPLPVKFRLIKSWKEYVKNNSSISIACNMTFKDYIIDTDYITNTKKRSKISESFAHANCVEFANRINSKVYKNAYKRYGKKLDMVCAIEGGAKDLRNNSTDKKIHTHIGIEKPVHYEYNDFKKLIQDIWTSTTWGNYINNINYIRNVEAYADYMVKDSLESLVLSATHIKGLEIHS